jgi:hypothetical protein
MLRSPVAPVPLVPAHTLQLETTPPPQTFRPHQLFTPVPTLAPTQVAGPMMTAILVATLLLSVAPVPLVPVRMLQLAAMTTPHVSRQLRTPLRKAVPQLAAESTTTAILVAMLQLLAALARSVPARMP